MVPEHQTMINAMQAVAEKTSDTQTRQVRVPPHSVDAERSVLGGLLLDNKAWDRTAGGMIAEDFYLPQHQALYTAIEDLAKQDQPFDCLTLTEHLKQTAQLDKVGGEAFVFELANTTPSAANIEAYVDIVRERAILRKLLGSSQHIADMTYNPEGRKARELVDIAEHEIFSILDNRSSQKGPEGIASVLAKTTDRIDTLYHSDGDVTGVSTGYNDLDSMTAGLQEGDLVIVAGRPSMGKTSFAMNIAEHAAIAGDKPVVIFSMEMPSESLAMRMLSSLGRINQHRVRTGKLTDEDWPRLTSAVSMMAEASMFIDDTPALSPIDLRSRARRIARQHGKLGLIVVDYLQLMQVPGLKENRTAEISEISRSLKGVAKELNCPVIALSQLNRSLEQRSDRRPVMSDLRESGAIEQDADLIAFIYRDEVYNDQSPDKGIAEIIIGKQRNGPIGKVRLTFLGEFTRFENYIPESADHFG